MEGVREPVAGIGTSHLGEISFILTQARDSHLIQNHLVLVGTSLGCGGIKWTGLPGGGRSRPRQASTEQTSYYTAILNVWQLEKAYFSPQLYAILSCYPYNY